MTEQKIQEIIQSAIKQAGHYAPSPETRREIENIYALYKQHIEDENKSFDDFHKKLDKMKVQLDLIFPSAKRDMENAEFWEQFWKRIKGGGGVLMWIVATIGAILILTGHIKTALLAFLFR